MEKIDKTLNGSMRPFIFEHIPVRGRLLRIPNITDQINSLETGEDAIASLLAEMLAASVVLAFDMKDKANITLQITSQGKLPVLLTKCNYKGVLRSFVKKEGVIDPKEIALEQEKESIFTVTVDYGRDKESYQSIVPISTKSISHTVENYFQQSSQLPTLFKVFSQTNEGGKTSCGAILLQAIPNKEPVSDDDWKRMELLLSTLRNEEVIPGDIKEIDLLSRLFAEDDVRVFHKQSLTFAADTNRARMVEALKSIGIEECKTLLEEENGVLQMKDEYTGQTETFTAADITEIFK